MKSTIKKVLCVAMAIVMMSLCLASCMDNEPSTSAPNESDTSSQTPVSTDDKVYTVGICQLVQHVALDSATEGFKKALTDKLGDKVVFDYQNASNEATNCTTICGNFVSNKVDLIMANATSALTAAATATSEIPIVATSITDYASALGIIDDWTGKTGYNVTGSSDLAPLDEQAKLFEELCPDAKTIGLIYCSSEANSKYQADVISGELTAKGIEVKTYTFTDSNDISAVVTSAVAECDALYVPTDNTAANNAEAINNIAEPAGIPIIAGESGICKGCGIATLSIDYFDIGYIAGEMAYEILTQGANPADMEIRMPSEAKKMYMADRCATLGITVPDTFEAIAAE